MNRRQRRKIGMKQSKPGAAGLQIRFGAKDGQVIVEFDDKLKWFAMDKPTAENFIANMQQQVNTLSDDKPKAVWKGGAKKETPAKNTDPQPTNPKE